jgi:hypothetical protein
MSACPEVTCAGLLLCSFLAACAGSPAGGDGSSSDRAAPQPERVEAADARREGGSRDHAPAPACLEQAVIDRLASPLSCVPKHIVRASTSQLPFDCHTQGIGWHAASSTFVVTCMQESDGDGARALSFPASANDGGEWAAVDAVALLVAGGAKHPSAIQIGAELFPVAMAMPSDSGPSSISFYRVAADRQLVGPVGSTIQHPDSHLGALAYATIRGTTQLLGCGWSCSTLTSWAAPGAEAASGFSRVLHASTQSLVDPGVDTNVGSYNSIYLTSRCGDGTPLLFASHDDWLDVWALSNLGKPSLRLRKIAKRQITEDVVLWNDRKLLYEGMTLELGVEGLRLWAAPHDFGTDSCPSGTRCAQYVYTCTFGS